MGQTRLPPPKEWRIHAEPPRSDSGAPNCMAKLDEAKVTAIRLAYWRDGVSMGKLGKRYGVTRVPIRKIVNGETWRHVPFPDMNEDDDV